MLGQSSTSPKRNCDEFQEDRVDEDGKTSSSKCLYDSERQGVVEVSLSKLQGSPDHLIKPSLRRFVLISNTLRHIKVELSSEGRVYDSERLGTIIDTQLVPEESPFLEFFGATDVGRVCVDHICKLERGSFADFVREPRASKVVDFTYARTDDGWEEAIAGENHDRTSWRCGSYTPQANCFMSPSVSSLSGLVASPSPYGLQESLKPCLPISEQTSPLDIPDLDVEMFGDVDVSQYDYDGTDWLLPSTNPNPKSPTQESVEDWLFKLQAENCMSNFTSDTAATGQVTCWYEKKTCLIYDITTKTKFCLDLISYYRHFSYLNGFP